MKKAEQQMESLQAKLEGLETALADNSLYEDGAKNKLKTTLADQATLKVGLEQAELDWFEATESLEAAQRDIA